MAAEEIIRATYKVRKPNGEVVEVNRFDLNLAYCGDRNRYIQCSDTSWVRVSDLTIVAPPPAFGSTLRQPEGLNPPPLELRGEGRLL